MGSITVNTHPFCTEGRPKCAHRHGDYVSTDCCNAAWEDMAPVKTRNMHGEAEIARVCECGFVHEEDVCVSCDIALAKDRAESDAEDSFRDEEVAS